MMTDAQEIRRITYALPYAKESFVNEGKYNGVTLCLKGKDNDKFSKYLLISSKGLHDTQENFEKVLEHAINQGFEKEEENDALFEYNNAIYYIYKKNQATSDENNFLKPEHMEKIIDESIAKGMKHPTVLGTEDDLYLKAIQKNYDENTHTGLTLCKTEEVFSIDDIKAEKDAAAAAKTQAKTDPNANKDANTTPTTTNTSDNTTNNTTNNTADTTDKTTPVKQEKKAKYLRYVYPKAGIFSRGMRIIPGISRLFGPAYTRPDQNLYFSSEENSTLSHIPLSLLAPRKIENGKILSSCFSKPVNVDFEFNNGDANFTYIIERQYLQDVETPNKPFTEEQNKANEENVVQMLDHAQEVSGKIANMFALFQEATTFGNKHYLQALKLTQHLKQESASKVLWTNSTGTQKCILHVINNKQVDIKDFKNKTSVKSELLQNTDKYSTVSFSSKDSRKYHHNLLQKLVHDGISECFKMDKNSEVFEKNHELLDLEAELRSTPKSLSRSELVEKLTQYKANNYPVINKTIQHSGGTSTKFYLCLKPALGGFIEKKAHSQFIFTHASVLADLTRQSALAIASEQIAHKVNKITNRYTKEMSGHQSLAQGAYSVDLDPIVDLQLDRNAAIETESALKRLNSHAYFYKGKLEDKGIPLGFELIVLKEKKK